MALDLAKAGDSKAWETLATYVRPQLTREATRLIGRSLKAKCDPDDLVQNALTEAIRRLPHIEGEKMLMPILFQTMRECVVNLLRRYRTKKRNVAREITDDPHDGHDSLFKMLIDDGTGPTTAVKRKEAVILIQNAVSQMDGTHQAIIWMMHQELMTMPEVAATLGRSVNTIKYEYRKALTSLAGVLAGLK